MSVHHQCIEAKALQASSVHVHFMLESSGFRLAKTVDVKDGHQVVELLDASKAQSFPDAALSTLSITNQTISPGGKFKFYFNYFKQSNVWLYLHIVYDWSIS